MKKKREPRFRILNASVYLLARNSYHSVGVREIAEKANVNISMISYYFGGKSGIMRDIVEAFYNLYIKAVETSILEEETGEQSIRRLFKNMVNMFREYTDLCMIGFGELPNDVEEVRELKKNKIKQLNEVGNRMSMKFGVNMTDNPQLAHIIGPAMMSMLFSHFAHKSTIKQVYAIEFNDQYYDDYTEVLSILFLEGINGLKNYKKV
jgi:AcrR family transcriptional regulator